MKDKLYYYKAKVFEIIDGDTFRVEVDLGFNIGMKIRIRLLNIDTPEKHLHDGIDEREYGFLAKDFAVKNFLNKEVYIKTIETDSFGRWLSELYFCDENGAAENIVDFYNKYGINKLSNTYMFDNFESVKNSLEEENG